MSTSIRNTCRRSRHSATARFIHQSAIANPELLSEQRRVRLSLVEGQRMSIQYVRVNKIQLEVANQHARISLYRSLPFIRGMNSVSLDQKTYTEACSRVYGVVMKVCAVLGEQWMCYAYPSNQNDVAPRRDDDSSSSEIASSLSFAPSVCRAVNDKRCKTCVVCGSARSKLRRKYSNIRRLAVATKERRAVLLQKLRKLDDDLYKCRNSLETIAHNLDLSVCEVETTMIQAMNAVIDLDLAQENVMQRVEVKAMEGILDKLLEQKKSQLMLLWGELCVIVQALYENAIPHVQKIVRRFLVRSRLDKIRRAYTHRVQSFSAIQIQRFFRAYLAVKRCAWLERVRSRRAALSIQCWTRKTLARFELDCRREKNIYQLHFEMLERIQSFVRRFLATRLRHRMAQDKFQQELQAAKEELNEKENRAANIIQCFIRQLIAKDICAAIRIESKLNPRVRFLANKFLLKGNVWAFLKRVSEDYNIYENTVAEIIRDEDLNATAFVEVLKERELRVANVWNDFEKVKQGRSNRQINVIDFRDKDASPQNKILRAQQVYSIAKPLQRTVGQIEQVRRKQQLEKYIIGSKVAASYASLIPRDQRGVSEEHKILVHQSFCDDSASVLNRSTKKPFTVEALTENLTNECIPACSGYQNVVQGGQEEYFRDSLNPVCDDSFSAATTDYMHISKEACENDGAQAQFRMALSNATSQIISTAASISQPTDKMHALFALEKSIANEKGSISRTNTMKACSAMNQSGSGSKHGKANSRKSSSSWIVQYSRQLTEMTADEEYQAYRQTPRSYF